MTSAVPPGLSFHRTMTILDVGDMTRAITFWRDKLGFAASTFGDPPGFAIMQRGTVTIALQLKAVAVVKPAPEWATYIYVADADAVLAECRQHGIPVIEDICDKFYNCRDFTIADPDGHSIGIGHVRNPDPWGPGLGAMPGRDAAMKGSP